MKCLTSINNNVIPVYEYIVDSCIYVEEKLVNNEQIKHDYLIYYDRYNTYKVKVTVNNFNVSCDVVDTINYGTDWLMNELTTFIFSHTNIPKHKWNKFIENNITLLYEFLHCDDIFEFTFEDDDEYIDVKFDITLNDFKDYISDYMEFVDDCVVRSNDMFKMLFAVDNQFDLKNHINNFIKDSFKCDIIYYNFSKIDHKMIAVKNKSTCSDLYHGYIKNRIINKDNETITFVNEYQEILDKTLDMLRSNPYIVNIIDDLMKSNNVFNIRFLDTLEKYVSQYLNKVYDDYVNYKIYLQGNYDQYVSDFNDLFTNDDIEIKYYENDMIMLSNKEENVFNIPQYIITCKDNFDFVTEYFKRINTFKKYIISDLNLNKKLEGRKNILITDVGLVEDEDLKKYMRSNYLQYINSLSYIMKLQHQL